MVNSELSPMQGKVKLLLVMRGYNPSQIDFSGEFSVLRYHYWKDILPEDCAYVKEHSGLTLTEREWHDEDCGWLVCYEITK